MEAIKRPMGPRRGPGTRADPWAYPGAGAEESTSGSQGRQGMLRMPAYADYKTSTRQKLVVGMVSDMIGRFKR